MNEILRVGATPNGELAVWKTNTTGKVTMTLTGKPARKIPVVKRYYVTFKKGHKIGDRYYAIIWANTEFQASHRATSEFEDHWEFVYDSFEHIKDRHLTLLKEVKKS